MYRDDLLIGSRLSKPAGDRRIEVVSPIDEQPVGSVPHASSLDVDHAVSAARAAFEAGPWPRMSVSERGAYVLRMAEALADVVDEAIRVQIAEMGGPYSFISAITYGSVAMIADEIAAASAFSTSEARAGVAGPLVVSKDPVGVVGAIIPWNGPFYQTLDALLPGLLSGCPVIVKPAPEAPLSPYYVADAAVAAGLPEGVLSVLPGGADTGEQLVAHPGIDRIMFTGSTAAGTRVAALCGQHLKSVTLELGGKSAAVVLQDAEIKRHLGTLIASSLSNNGQVCHATTRILVPRRRAQEWIEALVAAVRAMKVGDPRDPGNAFGPLVSERQRDRVEGYIAAGRHDGARLALGGCRPPAMSRGWYVEPTIFVDVDNTMTIAREEIFGPVVCVMEYEDEDHAVDLANDSDYGLGGAVFTDDLDRGLAVARRIKTGTCRINEAPPGGGGGPFGGVKRSGLGRKRGREGYDPYFETQTISLPADYRLALEGRGV